MFIGFGESDRAIDPERRPFRFYLFGTALLHEEGLRVGRGMVSFSYHTKTPP